MRIEVGLELELELEVKTGFNLRVGLVELQVKLGLGRVR